MTMKEKLSALEGYVSKRSGVSREELRGRSREKQIAEARAVVWVLAHDLLGATYSYIGRLYGRDHTTILNGAKRIRAMGKLGNTIEKIKKHRPELVKQSHLDWL